MTRAEKLAIIRDDSIRKLDVTKGGDRIEVTILDDGRFRSDVTGSVSSVNHGNAESFLGTVASLLGGLVKVTRRGHGHTHTHQGGHTHTH
jgi:hypothetical protein